MNHPYSAELSAAVVALLSAAIAALAASLSKNGAHRAVRRRKRKPVQTDA